MFKHGYSYYRLNCLTNVTMTKSSFLACKTFYFFQKASCLCYLSFAGYVFYNHLLIYTHFNKFTPLCLCKKAVYMYILFYNLFISFIFYSCEIMVKMLKLSLNTSYHFVFFSLSWLLQQQEVRRQHTLLSRDQQWGQHLGLQIW